MLALWLKYWRFHTVQGGIERGDHRFRPALYAVVDVWKDFLFKNDTRSAPGGARFKDFSQAAIRQ